MRDLQEIDLGMEDMEEEQVQRERLEEDKMRNVLTRKEWDKNFD